jgi:threonine dehydrogenase-like Zn-dependent dehydrogenase
MQSRVAVVTAYHEPLEIRSVPIPEIEPGGVLVKVDAATLCGTDAHRWEGGRAAVLPPFVPGHETCGIIVEMNGELRDIMDRPLRLGDRVISSYPVCGHCYHCRITRQTNLCVNTFPFGTGAPEQLIGGCADYHYFPPGCTLVLVPDKVSSPLAASAACALRTVLHGFDLLGPIESHETVVVQGAGPLGLYAVAAARSRGARKVIVIGAPSARLDVALAWGADAVLDIDEVPHPDARAAWVRSETGGRGPDVVVQCANTHALVEAMQLARLGARIISIGNSQGAPLAIPPELFFKHLRIQGVRMAEPKHFYEALEFLMAHRYRFEFDLLITGEYSLDRTSEAIAAMAELREVKPVIRPAA